MPFGSAAKFCREWARVSLWSFFSDVRVEGYKNASADKQPLIIAATHHNMLLDPAVLCNACSDYYLHYWAKSSIFVNEYATRFLNSVGCVPVNRESKDHNALYQATFDVLELKESIAVFPEGTSHTLPRLSKLREGASFVALEYAKSLRDKPRLNKHGEAPKPAAILPVGIVYTEKSKYRSIVIVRFGKPIQVTEYLSDFDKEPKVTAKKITKKLEEELLHLTINAPDWPSRKSAVMAREMLFPAEYGNMLDFVQVTQSLINIFAYHEDKKYLADNLYAYRCELEDLLLRDSDLADYSNSKRKLTSKYIAKDFAKKSFKLLKSLPLSLPVTLAHFPLYLISYYYGKHEVYEEVKAQDKILYSTLAVPGVYFILLLWVWYYLYRFTLLGFFFSIMTIVIFFWLHIVSIDRRYEQFKCWKGSFQLFDAFVLQRGLGRRRKRILEVFELRNALEVELDRLFVQRNFEEKDDDDMRLVKNALCSRAANL